MLQAGEIQAIIGDADRDGLGGQQYCGVWSLTSKHRPFNAFGNSYAGLLPTELRGKAPRLEVVDDSTCILSRQADDKYPVDVVATYTVAAPYYIDHTLRFTDRRDHRWDIFGWREVNWCNYMNCPADPRMHFLSGNEWTSYLSPEHGVGANIAPAYLGDERLERWPSLPEAERPFHWSRAPLRFDQPFYYGRLDDMVLMLIFASPQWLRFYCSPSGGGGSLLPGQRCPAWDFQWLIPPADYEVGREYELRMRMVYKRFMSNDDVLEEYRRFQELT